MTFHSDDTPPEPVSDDSRGHAELVSAAATPFDAPMRSNTRAWLWRAVAAVLLAGCAWLFIGDLRHTFGAPELGAGPDCDGNGRVDVLDAFGVARSLSLGASRPEWDFDGNGRVDRADADELARRAVSVGP